MTGLQRNLLLVNRKNKMQKQTGIQADMGADWWEGKGHGRAVLYCREQKIIPSSHSEGMTEEDRGSVAG